MCISLCAIRSWNWNWKLTQDNFLIERWIQPTHRCSAVRCWPWRVFSSWLASRDLGTTRSSYLAWVGPVVPTVVNGVSKPLCCRFNLTFTLTCENQSLCITLLLYWSLYNYAAHAADILTPTTVVQGVDNHSWCLYYRRCYWFCVCLDVPVGYFTLHVDLVS